MVKQTKFRILTANLNSIALSAARLFCSRLEVELPFALLIKDAVCSRTAATYVNPVAWHNHNRTRTEVFGRRRVWPSIPDSADNHVLDFAAMRMQPIVSSCGYFTHLCVGPGFGIARENGKLHALPFRQFDPF